MVPSRPPGPSPRHPGHHAGPAALRPASAVHAGGDRRRRNRCRLRRHPVHGRPAGTRGSLAVAGVFDVVKAGATEFAAGAKVYWDAAGKLAAATDGAGTHKLVGKAVRAAGAGTTTVRVRLSQ
ncbi:MAG: DUF2190 family protein [Thermogutta sp.]|nr:DUF2190 family protein [Thermogutta sp.]